MNGITILEGDCRETLKTLPDCSVHCVVTSPPYYGLRDYGCNGQIGLESTPDAFVAEMVNVFREVRRVLRDDGVCWLNLGDSYCSTDKWGGGLTNTGKHTLADDGSVPSFTVRRRKDAMEGIKPKDLIGIPWAVAFALRSDGWWLRQEIIWSKPNPMPESVSDRCSKSHEQIFLLTKSQRYYFDSEAIAEESVAVENRGGNVRMHESGEGTVLGRATNPNGGLGTNWEPDRKRNKRSVWAISSKPYSGAHFAVFPPDLIEPCVLAGTSEHGCCPGCGSPWERELEKDRQPTRPGNQTKVGRVSDDPGSPYEGHSGMIVGNRDPQRHCTTTKTIGWKPTCECGISEQVPCTVLDPFNGSGTTGEVARGCGCLYIGCELNPEYVALTRKRLQQQSLLV